MRTEDARLDKTILGRVGFWDLRLKEQTVRTVATIAGALALSMPLLGAAAPPAFTKRPTATRDGGAGRDEQERPGRRYPGAVRVEFAVDRETDVAVYVENAKVEIVRHLVAGVLGKNPPVPLKANSLEQSIAWEGLDDDGQAAAGGPFRCHREGRSWGLPRASGLKDRGRRGGLTRARTLYWGGVL